MKLGPFKLGKLEFSVLGSPESVSPQHGTPNPYILKPETLNPKALKPKPKPKPKRLLPNPEPLNFYTLHAENSGQPAAVRPLPFPPASSGMADRGP